MVAAGKPKIELDIRNSKPDRSPNLPPKAPEGAPNVLLLAWDDLGYATMDIFGGPVRTPNMRRIADRGVKYANFHTTALSSPTRAALLTGRNPTSNGMATSADCSAGFPGMSTRLPFESGFLSEVLAEHGYNTYCLGKWHLTPGEECNLSAYKGRWPLGRGFERFYGWLGGETNNWYPDLLHDNHPIDPPGRPEDGYHLAQDLADKAIEFIRDAKVIDPDKPFFMYLAPQAGHAPHQVPVAWADRYKGHFDSGYEAIREEILTRQIELGLLPGGTELTPMHPPGEPARFGADGERWPVLYTVQPWDALTDDERRLFARMAEVFAGYISYWDHHMGRVLDYLEESGQLDNTLVVVVSDNGASGEGGQHGEFNEWRSFNGLHSDPALALRHLDELGGPTAYNHYNTGWAWALDTPFPYWKRWAGAGGGVSDLCLMSWPAEVAASERPRQQYVHAVDIVPTVYELLGIDAPEVIKGYQQRPIEGESFAASLYDATVPLERTRFYTMLGQRALYQDGWLATTKYPPGSGGGRFEEDEWELYHLDTDRSQSRNVAPDHPDRLAALKDMWFYYAGKYDALPLEARVVPERVPVEWPRGAPPRSRYEYYPHCADVPECAGAPINGRSYTIAAGVEIASAAAEGVLYAHGGVAGGHSLYLKDRRLTYAFNWVGTHVQTVTSDRDVTPGRHLLTAEFVVAGPNIDPTMPGYKGALTLYLDEKPVGVGEIVTQPGYFCVVGDGRCVGRDSASPVTPDYADRGTFPFTGGTIEKVIVDVSGEHFVGHDPQVRAWLGDD